MRDVPGRSADLAGLESDFQAFKTRFHTSDNTPTDENILSSPRSQHSADPALAAGSGRKVGADVECGPEAASSTHSACLSGRVSTRSVGRGASLVAPSRSRRHAGSQGMNDGSQERGEKYDVCAAHMRKHRKFLLVTKYEIGAKGRNSPWEASGK